LESLESKIVDCAIRLTEALRDYAYTRKDEDKKRVVQIQQELLILCPNNLTSSSS
jgi:hypothetical protein